MVVAAASTAWWWSNRAASQTDPGGRTAQRTAAPKSAQSPNQTGDRDPIPDEPRDQSGSAPGTSDLTPFLRVFDGEGEALGSLLALTAPERGRQHYCTSAVLLPTEGRLHTAAAEPLDFEVITWDRLSGLVLLVGPAVDPRSERVAALAIADTSQLSATDSLTAISPAGRRWTGIHVQPQTVPLVADQRVPPGSVLVDSDGRAVALMGRNSFLLLGRLAHQQRHWRGTDLDQTQKAIRASDPQKVVEDVQRLVDSESTNLERVAAAILLLQKSQHLARDRQAIETFDKLMRWVHHQRIRLASGIDGKQALAHALASFRQFADHHGIHADAVTLLLQHGDPLEGLRLFQSLQAASAEQSEKIVKQVAKGVSTNLRRLSRIRNDAAAITLGAEAVRILPARPDLRMAYSLALLQAGDRDLARAQGLEAVRLDPTYQARFDRMGLGTSTRGSRRAGTVVIPFDPREKQIRTTGTIGGQRIQFVVDTGASYTTVPHQLAKNLGLLGQGVKIEVETANGRMILERVVLPTLSIAGGIYLKNVNAMVLDMGGNLHNSALLGLDVLQKLNLRIDSDNHRLILRQPRKRRGR